MTDLRTAAQQALEALETWTPTFKIAIERKEKAITALRNALAEQRLTDMEQEMERSIASLKAALAEPVQEPVQEHEDWCASVTQLLLCYPPRKAPCNCKPTAPPQRQPLTEEEIEMEWRKASEFAGKSEGAVTTSQFVQIFARAIERKVRGDEA